MRSRPVAHLVGSAPVATRRERIEQLLDDVLRPLLARDGGGVELVKVDDDEVVLVLTGVLVGDPAAGYVKRGVVEPALATVLGPGVKVRYERRAFSD